MKIASIKTHWGGLWGFVVLALIALPAQALDIKGYTTPTDDACWVDPNCSKARGGDTDVMTIYKADGSIFDQIFAFGAEEKDNVYYFDPTVVSVDPNEFGFYTTLLETDGITWSDNFGIADLPGIGLVLGFISDPNIFAQPPLNGLTFIEEIGILNPVPEVGSLDSKYLTIPYDATRYLSEQMRRDGFTATFRSDVPEPDLFALMALAAVGLMVACRRRV